MGMTREAIDAELRMLGHPVDKSAPALSTPSSSMTKSQIDAELASLGADTGFMHRVGQLGRGILSGVGSDIEFLQPKNPELRATQSDPEQVGGAQYFFPEESAEIANSTPTSSLEEELPKLAGLDEQYEPSKNDTLGKGLNLGGKFLSPSAIIPGGGYLNVGKKFTEQGFKSGVKALGKEAAMSGVGAAAITATPRMYEEGTASGAIEDLAKGMFGIKAADKLVQKNVLKAAARAPKNAFMGTATAMAKPNERALSLAKEHGVDLPFNVGMRSKPMNWMANNYLKSIFTSGVYEDALKNSNESMVNAVKRNIDELGPSTLKPSEASGEYRRFIELEEKSAEEAASKLYDDASKSLKKGDSVKPINTAKFIGNMEEMLSRDIQSPATKKVANIVGSLAESWGISPPGKTLKQLENNPKLIEAYLTQFKKQLPQIPVEKLIGIRKELGTITKFDPTIKGSESYLNGLKSVINKDIETMSNKEFLSKWRNANSVFKNDVADRFRGDVARSLLSNEMPTEAYSLLNTPQNVREIEKIAGKSEKSKEIFDALKKAKVRDIFSASLQDESLRVSPFINVFNRKEKTAELLESLVGKPQFNKLSEISEIAEEFKHANQELLNTSRTALTSSEIAKAEKLTKGVLSTIFNGAVGSGVGALAGIGTTGGAVVGMAMPNLISRLVSNPKFVNEARAYAIARKNNRQIYSETILKRLIKLTDAEQRLMMTEARSVDNEKD